MLSLPRIFSGAEVIAADDRAGVEFFEKKIRPVLIAQCYNCHSAAAKEVKGGLLVDSAAALRAGGDSGPAVTPGKLEESLLIEALRHESFEMPPDKKLPATVIADFEAWIKMGAPDPRITPADPQARFELARKAQFEQLQDWWSLRPPSNSAVPDVQNKNWSSQPIDRFVLAKLEEAGISPAPRATRGTLIRRLSFVLTGLPPSPGRFAEDPGGAVREDWEKIVDELLASPHFGEHWARHWMDVVRYTDTYGYEWDMPAKGAWRYRDYLIRAFNEDVPFDQLVREQIAGDLLERPRINQTLGINESLIGPMFFQMGEKRHGDSAQFDGIHQEMLDNKIDAFSKAFQAQTIACARCHDHKLDPILQAEYYALGGTFMSSRWVTNTLDTPERNAPVLEQLREIKQKLRPVLAARWLDDLKSLPEMMLTATALSQDELEKSMQQKAWGELFLGEAKEPAAEDIRLPWFRAVSAAKNSKSVAETWVTTGDFYRELTETRLANNKRDYQVVADFREKRNIPVGWSVDGVGLREMTHCGDFVVALEGSAAVTGFLPGGLFTYALSPKLNGAIRTPYLNQFSQAKLSFEHTGGDFSAHRTVIDNAFLSERQAYLNQSLGQWLTLSTLREQPQRHNFIEIVTKTSNPNFPPRVGLGGECSNEQIRDPRSWFGVTRVLAHDKAAGPADELARFGPLLKGDAPTNLEQVVALYTMLFRESVTAFGNNTADEDDVQLLNWMLDHNVLSNQQINAEDSELAGLISTYREVEAQVIPPETVNGMRDIDPGYDYPINLRGEYDQLGALVPRGYAHAIAGSPDGFRVTGSGRHELAELIASEDNPLTARVFVNRVWCWLFDEGIVATPSDFGHAGELPSHPELLDALTVRFVKQGWSLKKLVREIVLSETWCQSSQSTEKGREIDPANRLLHHAPLRRLEAESIRDAMLVVSGSSNDELYGPTIDPHRPNEDPQKRLFCGPLDGNGRRSLYTKVTIMEPPRLLALFNQPAPKISTGKRDVTSTPAQSLAFLNDPFINLMAENWARKLTESEETGWAERIDSMFQSAYDRQPTAAERSRWVGLIEDLAQLHDVKQQDVPKNVGIWKDVAHTLFITKEFVYLK